MCERVTTTPLPSAGAVRRPVWLPAGLRNDVAESRRVACRRAHGKPYRALSRLTRACKHTPDGMPLRDDGAAAETTGGALRSTRQHQ